MYADYAFSLLPDVLLPIMARPRCIMAVIRLVINGSRGTTGQKVKGSLRFKSDLSHHKNGNIVSYLFLDTFHIKWMNNNYLSMAGSITTNLPIICIIVCFRSVFIMLFQKHPR